MRLKDPRARRHPHQRETAEQTEGGARDTRRASRADPRERVFNRPAGGPVQGVSRAGGLTTLVVADTRRGDDDARREEERVGRDVQAEVNEAVQGDAAQPGQRAAARRPAERAAGA